MRWGEIGGGGGGEEGEEEHYETTPSLSCPGRPASGQNGGPPASLKKAEHDLFFFPSVLAVSNARFSKIHGRPGGVRHDTTEKYLSREKPRL